MTTGQDLGKLAAMRGAGESHSDVILRIVAEGAINDH